MLAKIKNPLLVRIETDQKGWWYDGKRGEYFTYLRTEYDDYCKSNVFWVIDDQGFSNFVLEKDAIIVTEAKVKEELMTEQNQIPHYDLNCFANDCYLFNELAGRFDGTITLEALGKQASLIDEELKETLHGISIGDNAEILDGIVDVAVTAIGLIHMLEASGFDVNRALEKIARNNLSKYPKADAEGIQTLSKTIEMYEQQGVPVKFKVQDERIIIQRKDTGKIMKPHGFESVDLSDCLPKE